MKIMLANEKITITNLAMLSRINHQRCRELVHKLKAAGYIDMSSDGKRQYVALTESGHDFATRLLEVGMMSARAKIIV